MKPRPGIGLILAITALTLGGGALLAAQWRETTALRIELEQARSAQEEWRRLQAEHERLQAQQIPAAELERLRADHAALPRLRAELDALKKQPAPR